MSRNLTYYIECQKQGRVNNYGGNIPWFDFRISRENRGSLSRLLTYLLACLFAWEEVGGSVVTFPGLYGFVNMLVSS